MKRILAFAILAAMMLALAIPASAVKDVTANKFTPVIDGVLDDGYNGPYDIDTPHFDDEGNPEDRPAGAATGKVWMAWDDTSIYYYIEVYDTTPNHDDGAEDECVELYFDWNNGHHDSDEGSDEAPMWQLKVGPVDPDALYGYTRDGGGANWGQGSYFEEYSEWFVGPLNGSYNNGYIVEIKVSPPSDIITLSEGKVITTDYQLADNMEGAGRTCITFFDHIGAGINDNDRWNTSAYLQARLTLGGPPQAAVVEEEPEPMGGGEEADAQVVVPKATPTGDSAVMFIVLAAVLAGAFVVTKKVRTRA